MTIKKRINTFDIDGVIFQKDGALGMRPNDGDVIITGRPLSEMNRTNTMLIERGIYNLTFFNLLDRHDPDYGRVASGKHKAAIITWLQDTCGYEVMIHFEDDEVQIREIKKVHPDLRIIHCVRWNEPVDDYDGVN